MDSTNIVAVMKEAKQESYDIGLKLLEMEKLQQRKANLEAFIAQCQLLLGEPTQEIEAKPLIHPYQAKLPIINFTRHTNGSSKESNWERARKILMETNNNPLKLSELVLEFKKREYKLSEKNAKEVVRSAVRNKPDLFSHDPERFTYWLKEVPIGGSSPAETPSTPETINQPPVED